MMKTSCYFIFLATLIFRGNGDDNSLRLLYPAYKLIEDAVVGNPETRFLLKQTFFPSTNYRYWQVDGAEAIPINVCVTLHNNTEQPPWVHCNLTDIIETDRNMERNCTELWKFLWTNSLLLNVIPGDVLLAMDTTVSLVVYSEIIQSSHYRMVTLHVHLNELALSCAPSLDDMEQAFVLLLSTVSIN